MVDTLLIILGGSCIILGFAGLIVPVLPGPIMSYAALFFLHFSSLHSFSTGFLIIYGLLALFVTAIDMFVPVYGTKKFNGTKYGVWGSTVGLLVGAIFFPPFGLIVGPVAGAFLGEVVNGKKPKDAIWPAFGSFIGFLAGMVVKLTYSIVISYHFIVNLF